MLGIASLLLHALLVNAHPGVAPVAAPEGHPLMLQLVARMLLPFTVLVAAYFYLRGHNLPGGGFIAGLVLAMGLLLQAVSHGHSWVAQRASQDYRAGVGWGLLLAVLTGLAAGGLVCHY